MSKALRDKIRESVFKNNVKKKKFTYEGNVIEIRQPTVGEWNDLRKNSGDDTFKLQVLAVINHCYVDGTNEKVFTVEDEEVLRNCPVGGFVDEISAIFLELCNLSVDTVKKS